MWHRSQSVRKEAKGSDALGRNRIHDGYSPGSGCKVFSEVMILLQEAIVDAQSVRIRALEMEARTLQVLSLLNY